MGLHGSIEEAGLPNVLQLLALGGKTGCVAVERGTVNGTIYLEAGVVTWAELVSGGDRLGDHLVRSGKITREQLRWALEKLTLNASATLAEVLVESGSIARGELDRFVQHQVEEAVYQMFAWTKGQFHFTSNSRPPRHATMVSLPAERLLLEAGRRADDWVLIQTVIPSFDGIYKRASLRGPPKMEQMSAEQHRILPLLDGTRDVHGLIELSGLSSFEVGKALYELIAAGAAVLQERRSSQHFEDAELEAYALKSGAFADPERRKDAARHIADCHLCGGRLRQFHVRRTQEQAPQAAAAPPPRSAATPQPPRPAPPPPTPPSAPPVPPVPPEPPGPKRAAPATPPVTAGDRMSKDLVWLTSPQEADEIRRTSRRAAAPPPAAAPQPPKPPAAPAATPPPPPVPPPASKPGVTAPLQIVRPPARPIEKPAAAPAPTAPPTPPPVPVVPAAPKRISVAARAPAEAPPAAKKLPVRALAIGGVAVLVAAGAFVALRPRVATPARAVAAAAPPAAAPTVTAPPVTAPPAGDTTPNGNRRPAMGTPATTPSRDTLPTRTVAAAPPRVATPVAPPTPVESVPSRRPPPPRDTTPPPPTVSAGPDIDLAAGGWRAIERAEAITALSGRLGAIPGLRIESFASSEARGRTRVRIAQIARTGQRIVLIETSTAAASSGSARATAVSVMDPAETSGEAIGSASLGNLQITARSTLPADALRSLLQRLAVVR